MEWRIIKKYGRTFVEGRYATEEWSGWLFPVDTEPHTNWVFMPELGLYRRNYSI